MNRDLPLQALALLAAAAWSGYALVSFAQWVGGLVRRGRP